MQVFEAVFLDEGFDEANHVLIEVRDRVRGEDEVPTPGIVVKRILQLAAQPLEDLRPRRELSCPSRERDPPDVLQGREKLHRVDRARHDAVLGGSIDNALEGCGVV